ncbi:hypothetical protein [Geothrix sp.]|jgi:hypothetical protein|uniref:hypothetical protein n=1 Tax=Geothrix sp. TaxID=1962974 RepID=UPI0025C0BF25|nr:hypothetical protein [Geothrix sp.]
MGKITWKGSVPANDPMFFEGPLIASTQRSSAKSTTAPDASSGGADLPNPMQEVEDGMEAWLQAEMEKGSRLAQAENTPSPQSGSTTLPKED